MNKPPQLPQSLEYVALEKLSEDDRFRLRHLEEISSLAQSIAQVGQLSPIEVREEDGKLQPLTGFRRLRALRLLHRKRVLIRNHGVISDEVAATIAAADAIESRALELEELREMGDRYGAMGWSTPALEEMITRAVERAEERLEDLEAKLRGEAPPDRTVVDEDELEADEDVFEPLSAILGDVGGAPGKTLAEPNSQAPAAEEVEAGGLGASVRGEGPPSVAIRQRAGADRIAAEAAAKAQRERTPADAQRETTLGDETELGDETGLGDETALGRPGTAESVILREARPAAPPETAPSSPSLAGTWTLADPKVELAPRVRMSVEELAQDLAERFAEISQDLSVLADHWSEVPVRTQGILSDQLDYYCQLSSWLDHPVGEKKRDHPSEP